MIEIHFSKPCTDEQLESLVMLGGTSSSIPIRMPTYVENAHGQIIAVKIDPDAEFWYREWASDNDLDGADASEATNKG